MKNGNQPKDRKLKVLVVDDNETHRLEAIAALIPRQEHVDKRKISLENRVLIAKKFFDIQQKSNPEEARELLLKKTFIPDIIILDIVYDDKGEKLSLDLFEELRSKKIFSGKSPLLILYSNQADKRHILTKLSRLNLFFNDLIEKSSEKGGRSQNLELLLSNQLQRFVEKTYFQKLQERQIGPLDEALKNLLVSDAVDLEKLPYLNIGEEKINLKYLLVFSYSFVFDNSVKTRKIKVVVDKSKIAQHAFNFSTEVTDFRNSDYNMNGPFKNETVMQAALKIMENTSECEKLEKKAKEIVSQIINYDYELQQDHYKIGRDYICDLFTDFSVQNVNIAALKQILLMRLAIIYYVGFYSEVHNPELRPNRNLAAIKNKLLLRVYLIFNNANLGTLTSDPDCVNAFEGLKSNKSEKNILTEFFITKLGFSTLGLKAEKKEKRQGLKLQPPKIFNKESTSLKNFITSTNKKYLKLPQGKA